MLARVYSCAVIGLEGVPIEVEVDSGPGLPAVVIVGLPDAAVQESRERVHSAIKNAGLSFPRKRITINLAPAAVRKEGPAYDLPIAIGILAAAGELDPDCLNGSLVVGELSLDGSVRHVRGVLAMAAAARAAGYKRFFVPVDDAAEAALIPEIEVFPVPNLAALYAHLTGGEALQAANASEFVDMPGTRYGVDFSEIRGQEQVKRAMEIAAAGGHNVLML